MHRLDPKVLSAALAFFLLPANAAHAEREAGGRVAMLAVQIAFAADGSDEAARAAVLKLSGDAVARGTVVNFVNLLASDEPSLCLELDGTASRVQFEGALRKLRGGRSLATQLVEGC